MSTFTELMMSWIGTYQTYSEVWIYLFDMFSWIFSNKSEPKLGILFTIFVFLYLLCYFIILYSIGLTISKNFKLNKVIIWENAKYFSWTYLLSPIFMFVYPLVLWFSDVKIKQEIKHILIGIFFWLGLLVYYGLIWPGWPKGITIMYMFPIFILLMLIWKTDVLSLKIIKYWIVLSLILILFTQPFYKKWFYDREGSDNQKICYSRNTEKSNDGTCFKIFKWFETK